MEGGRFSRARPARAPRHEAIHGRIGGRSCHVGNRRWVTNHTPRPFFFFFFCSDGLRTNKDLIEVMNLYRGSIAVVIGNHCRG